MPMDLLDLIVSQSSRVVSPSSHICSSDAGIAGPADGAVADGRTGAAAPGCAAVPRVVVARLLRGGANAADIFLFGGMSRLFVCLVVAPPWFLPSFLPIFLDVMWRSAVRTPKTGLSQLCSLRRDAIKAPGAEFRRGDDSPSSGPEQSKSSTSKRFLRSGASFHSHLFSVLALLFFFFFQTTCSATSPPGPRRSPAWPGPGRRASPGASRRRPPRRPASM